MRLVVSLAREKLIRDYRNVVVSTKIRGTYLKRLCKRDRLRLLPTPVVDMEQQEKPSRGNWKAASPSHFRRNMHIEKGLPPGAHSEVWSLPFIMRILQALRTQEYVCLVVICKLNNDEIVIQRN